MKAADFKVLIIDNGKAGNSYLKRKLSDLGCDTAVCEPAGEKAVKYAKDYKPDISIINISPPVNFNKLDDVEKISSSLNIPSIILLEKDDKELDKRIKANDLYTVLKEPVSDKELEINICVAVSKHGYLKTLREKEDKLVKLNKKLNKEVKSRDFYEKQILRSKKIYYSSFNALKESIFVIDRDLNIILENKALKEFNRRVGINEPTLGNSVDIFSNNLKGFNLSDYVLVLRTGEEIYDEEVQLNEDTIVEIRKSPVLDENEIVSRVITSIKDITANKNTEHKLIRSEKKFRDLMELLPEMIFETDLNGDTVYANQFAIERLDYTYEDISKGLNIFDIFAAGEKDRAKKHFKECLADRQSGPEEYYILTYNNEKFPVILHTNPIIENNRAIGVRGVMIDITDRKKAEEELKQSLQTTKAIVNSIPDLLLHLSRDGVLLNYKGTREEQLPMPADKILNKNIKEVIPGGFTELVMESIESCISKGEYVIEYQMRINDVLKDFEGRFEKINDNEVVALIRDMSERKSYEKEMKEAREKAVEANKAKSEFLANMSHEIRTPMNAILGLTESLLTQINTPAHRGHLKTIHSSGEILLSLINDILDLSKIEANKLEMHFEPAEIRSIIQEIKQIFVQKTNEKGLAIEVEVDKNIPHMLILDEVRLRQILLNLVGNAIKFTNEGYIKIIVLGDLSKDSKIIDLQISIEDTGIGIPADQQKAIFDAFKQQKGQSTRKYGGTGLGLTICKRLAEKMRGRIELTSTQDKGSVFKVILPKTKVSDEGSLKIPETEQELLSVDFYESSVMIVDDIKSNIETVKSLISGDVNFIEALTGKEAVEKLQNCDPDAIIMDMRMPEMDGLQTAKYIRNVLKKKNIPIIAFTASVLGFDNKVSKKYFSGFLPKPVKKSQITAELKKYLKYRELYESGITEHEDLSFSIENMDKPELDKLITAIDANYLPKWEEIKDDMLIFEIEEFAEGIDELARQYDVQYLSDYAGRLNESIQSFDIDKIKLTVNEFFNIVENIKSSIVKSNS